LWKKVRKELKRLLKEYHAFTYKMHDLVSDVNEYSRKRAKERREIKEKLAQHK
jgi:hypothetical protein